MFNKLRLLLKDLILILTMGVIYYRLEILYRGYSSYWMILVGGLCCFFVGKLNEHPIFFERKMWQQCVTGTLITLCIELFSGMFFNIYLRKHIWDYSDMKFNLYGQICLAYSIFWFFLMPLAIYIDDWLRWKLFKEEKPSGLLKYYKDLFVGK